MRRTCSFRALGTTPLALALLAGVALAGTAPTQIATPGAPAASAAHPVMTGRFPPLKTPFLGQVATNDGYVPNALIAPATATQASYRQPHTALNAGSPITTLKIVLPCWYVIPGATDTESTIGAASTWKAYVEYPAGTLQAFTFSGSTTGTCTDGQNFASDTLTLTTPIPDGARFWTNGYETNSAGIAYKSNPDGNSQNGQYFVYGTSVADPGTTIPTNSTGHGTLNELALLSTTAQRSFGIIDSDSRAAGFNDSPDNTGQPRPDVGNLARSIGTFAPYINLAVSSSRADGFLNGQHAQRLALMTYVTDAVMENTINDAIAGVSAATIESNLVAARALLPATMPVSLTTSEPHSSTNNVAISALTANGPALNGTSTGAARLFPGEMISIAGASPSTDNGFCFVVYVTAPNFGCMNPQATGSAAATGTITYNDYWQSLNNQVPNATDNPIRVAVNNWKRGLTLSLAGFSHVFDTADFTESGRDSGRWGVVYVQDMLANPSAVNPLGAPTYDGLHESPVSYVQIQKAGIISAVTAYTPLPGRE